MPVSGREKSHVHAGILALSFGRSDSSKDVGPSNIALAEVVKRVYQETRAHMALQWEIASHLQETGWRGCDSIGLSIGIPGIYIDSDEVIRQAHTYFCEHGVCVVHLIAHPFLHRYFCAKMLERYGYTVCIPKTGWIPFDKEGDPPLPRATAPHCVCGSADDYRPQRTRCDA